MFASETTSTFQRIIPSRTTRWIALCGFWSAIAFLSALHWRVFSPPGDPWTLWGLIWIKHVVWFAWGFVATPIILWLGNRFRLEREHWLRHLLLLSMASLVITAAYVFAYAWLLAIYIEVPQLAHFDPMLHFTLFHHSTYYFLAFWGTIGLEQGLWYYRRWHEREMQTSELRSQLAQAQLEAIRAQIQPHFLFNALNTLSSAILDGDKARAYDLTAKLGELLRFSLERGKQDLVTLAEEIELVERYLELVKARFEDRLDVSIELALGTEQNMVPSFVLQPLVENSVKHVVAHTNGRVTISVRSSLAPDQLILEVEDRCACSPVTAQDNLNVGHGYRLTKDRLGVLYGTMYSLEAEQSGNGGTLVRIGIPLEWRARDEGTI